MTETPHAAPPATLTAVKPLDAAGIATLIGCCVIWGGTQVAVKIAGDAFAPISQAGWRSAVAGLLLIGWMLVRGIAFRPHPGTRWLGLTIGVIFAVEFMLLYEGLARTTAARGVLFLYATPFFVAIGAHVFIVGDRLTLPKVTGLVAAFCGLALALGDGVLQVDHRPEALLGDVLCLMAAAGWAAVTVIVRASALRHERPEMQLGWQLGVSAVLLLALSSAVGEPLPDLANTRAVLAFAYTAVIVAFFSYVIWFWLLTRYAASQVSSFTFLAPIFGALTGHLVLGEPLSWRFVGALALVAFGITLVNRRAAR